MESELLHGFGICTKDHVAYFGTKLVLDDGTTIDRDSVDQNLNEEQNLVDLVSGSEAVRIYDGSKKVIVLKSSFIAGINTVQ